MITEYLEKLKRGVDWVLWWRVDQDELDRQVAEYDALGITRSARKISFALLLLSALITATLVYALGLRMWGYVDAALLAGLGFLTYRGQRWAILAAMVVWTLQELALVFSPTSATVHVSAVVSLVWWAIYMHALFMAWCVENARDATGRHAVRT